MWKLMLWGSPLDADITVELLTTWRDELVAAGKLIPYEVDGKAFLYIKTFLQHEHPRNPQRPDLPLPPWVKCESVEGVAKDGKRWVRTTYADTQHAVRGLNSVSTEAVQTPQPRPAPSRVPKGTSGKGVGPKSSSDRKAAAALCPACLKDNFESELTPDEDTKPHCAACGWRPA
jgi:hypothetical protein